ncbi:MAG: transposase [Gemmataceae bacterium]|nr:transposase [Gemmataceae bacterium]
MIPTLSTRKEQRVIDKEERRRRNVVERFWAKAKRFRRVATRYGKTKRDCLASVQVASVLVALRETGG